MIATDAAAIPAGRPVPVSEHRPPADRVELVTCRPIRPDDADRLCRLLTRLSPETRYRRFFSPVTSVSPRLLRHLVEVDHHDREALVALVGDEIIAVARYDRDHDDPALAEVAVVVEDDWQGHGVGRFLMTRLGIEADRRGITRFGADVLPSNDVPVKLARAVAPMVEVSFRDGETHLLMPLRGPRTRVSAAPADQRPRIATQRSA